nr:MULTISPECIES: PAS domain S-box protein [Myxococcaceae]
MLEHAPMLVWRADAVGRCNYFNSTWLAFTGLTLEEATVGWVECLHPDDRPRVLETGFAYAVRREPFELEFRLRRHDGAHRWMLDRGVPYFDEAGEFAGYIGSLIDVHEAHERARRALEESEQRFRSFMEHSPIAASIKDEQGRYLFLNPGAVSQHGKPMQELLGRTLEEVHPGAQTAEIHRGDLRAVREQRVLEALRCVQTAAGPREWLTVVFPIERPGGTPLLGKVALETTARRLAEDALRRSEASFRTLIEASTDCILVLRDAQVVYANPRGLRTLGVASLAQLQPRALAQLLHGGDAPALVGHVRALAEGVAPPPPAEYRFHCGAGGERTAEVQLLAIEFDGAPCVMLVARDITERAELQRRLMAADRLVSMGTLAAGMAHEINNPLSYVLGNLGYLEAQLARAQEQALLEVVREAREGAERVRQIVRDLKTLSRGDDERRGPVDVLAVLQSSINMAWNEIRHRARLVRDFSPVPRVQANESRLGQVFLNLLVNAAQAIPEGRADRHHIEVRVYPAADGRVAVEVRDSGEGIAREHLPRIFDPFFTSKPIGEGTGLGLAICHGIVSQLGGSIEVESERGQGTCMRVFLPQAPEESAPAPGPGVRAGRRGRLLFIDDEPRIGKTYQLLLRDEHDVLALTRAQEALERLRAGEHFDLVFCDLMMPEMTGMDLHAELSRWAPEKARAMVFLTGGAFTPKARAFLSQVDNCQLEKPVSPDALRRFIRDALG